VGGGLFAAALLVLTPLWQIVSRLNYTDVLASGFGAVGMAAVGLDPKLERRRSCVVFGVACAAAILA
jgi:4-amino-4-deoxy-L-arabinose transferase-like glycosyltransferase